jgi:hypothetical protein
MDLVFVVEVLQAVVEVIVVKGLDVVESQGSYIQVSR